MQYLIEGRKVFNCECTAIKLMKESLDENFSKICKAVDNCSGRVCLTGMGKSGHICQKIVATMQSLGIKAYFLHPAEALHGDLGMLTSGDIVIAVSNSGETDEILGNIPTLQLLNIPIYSIIGKKNSTLEKFSKVSIIMPPFDEAYLESIVPTSSTTVSLMLGDAIAVAVAKRRGFSSKDFGLFHPRGTLGKRLTLRVETLMLKGEENAVIKSGSTIEDAVYEMCKKAVGGVNIISNNEKLLGVFTDGDFRRLHKNHLENINSIIIDSVMTKQPIILNPNDLVYDVIKDMKNFDRKVSFYPVAEEGRLVGRLRLIDISKAGLI